MQEIIIGDCRLINADSYEWIKTNNPPRCMITDPPYEFKASGGGRFRKERPNMDDIQEAGLDKGFDHTIINPLLFDSLIVFCHNDQMHKILPYLAGNYYRHIVLPWIKTNPLPVANKNYDPSLELFIQAWNEDPSLEWFMHVWDKGFHPDGKLPDLKRHYIGKNGKDKNIDHPTAKPLELMNKIVRNANAQEIFDPFMGSCATGLACIEQGKKFVGIEKNPKYFDIAVKRIEEFYKNALTNNNQ